MTAVHETFKMLVASAIGASATLGLLVIYAWFMARRGRWDR